jgi:hypothetical protein
MKEIREFKSGATRDISDGKHQISKFINPLNDHSFCTYMHSKRIMADGSVREGDNWQKGMGLEVLEESFVRHMDDFKKLHLGFHVYKVRGDDGETTYVSIEPIEEYAEFEIFMEETLNGIRFNCEAYKLQVLGYKLEDKLSNTQKLVSDVEDYVEDKFDTDDEEPWGDESMSDDDEELTIDCGIDITAEGDTFHDCICSRSHEPANKDIADKIWDRGDLCHSCMSPDKAELWKVGKSGITQEDARKIDSIMDDSLYSAKQLTVGEAIEVYRGAW